MYVGPDKTKFYVGPDKTKFYVDSDPAKFYVGPGQTNPEFNYTSVRTELNILILRRSQYFNSTSIGLVSRSAYNYTSIQILRRKNKSTSNNVKVRH